MIFKYLTKSFYINLSIIFLIFFLDRASKLYVIYLDKKNLNSKLFSSEFLNIDLIWNEGIAFGLFSFNQNNLGSDIFNSAYLNIVLIWNKGIAFGLFSFNESHLYNILSLIISIIVVILVIMSLKSHGFKRYSLLMIVGGALGNLHDRIFFNAVPDFIDFHIGNFHWFIFNVSDIFITLGVISMIVLELADNKTEETK